MSHLIKNMSINPTSYDRIYEIVRLIPKGQVARSPLRFGTDYLQRSLLESEGIIFNGTDQIDLRKYLWKPRIS